MITCGAGGAQRRRRGSLGREGDHGWPGQAGPWRF